MFILSMFFLSTNCATATDDADALINPQTGVVNTGFDTFSQSGDIEEPRSFFQRATSCLSGLKKKYVIPAVVISVGALTAGITYWRLHTQDQSPSAAPICPVASEEFWPIDPISSGILNSLMSNIANNQIFFSTISSLWALSCNGFNSSSCAPATSTFTQMMTSVGTIMGQNIDQEVLKNYVLTYGTIECEVHPKSSKAPGQFVCYPCSDRSTEFCNGITDGFRGFRSPEAGLICPVNSKIPSSVSIFFYNEPFYQSETSRTDTLFVFSRSNNIIGSKVEPSPFPVGNCTYYAEYLNHSYYANSILSNTDITCGWPTTGTVNLVRKNIDDSDVLILAPALQQLSSNTRFDFSNNNIRVAGMNVLGEVFRYIYRQGSPSLCLIRINNNYIDSNGLIAFVSSASPTFMRRILTDLSMSNTGIGPSGIAALIQALRANQCSYDGVSSLKTLDISSNYIEDSGIAELSNRSTYGDSCCVGVLGNLNRLNISDNGITDTGAIMLASMMFGRSAGFNNGGNGGNNLCRLYLNKNNIGPTGAISLASALNAVTLGYSCSDNNAPPVFDISSNNIGGAGAAALVKAFCSSYGQMGECMGGMPRLNIASNGIGVNGATAIASILSSCQGGDFCYPLDLDISNNGIMDAGADVLALAFSPLNPTFPYAYFLGLLDLSLNNISEFYCTKLTNAIKKASGNNYTRVLC